MKVLCVIDMQNDFITGPLGSPEAEAVVKNVAERIVSFDGPIFYTMDTHDEEYMNTLEGKHLPILHCVRGTTGHVCHREIARAFNAYNKKGSQYGYQTCVEKSFFAANQLPIFIKNHHSVRMREIDEIVVVGLCTDICVIYNVLTLKAWFPEAEVTVDVSCCAGTTPEMHKKALDVMRSCQVNIVGGDNV